MFWRRLTSFIFGNDMHALWNLFMNSYMRKNFLFVTEVTGPRGHVSVLHDMYCTQYLCSLTCVL